METNPIPIFRFTWKTDVFKGNLKAWLEKCYYGRN
jgi:hypothetical protein